MTGHRSRSTVSGYRRDVAGMSNALSSAARIASLKHPLLTASEMKEVHKWLDETRDNISIDRSDSVDVDIGGTDSDFQIGITQLLDGLISPFFSAMNAEVSGNTDISLGPSDNFLVCTGILLMADVKITDPKECESDSECSKHSNTDLSFYPGLAVLFAKPV